MSGRGKRDTPVKVAFTWQHARKRRQKCKIYETLPEEPDVDEDPDVKKDPDEKKFKWAAQTSAQSSPCQSSSTAFARKRNITQQELTLEGAITKPMVSSSSSVDDDEDDDSFSSYSSSVPSPEIFRDELYAADTSHFPAVGDVADLHVQVKNSTLISSSHAESILSHPSPNVSTILVAAEKPLKTMTSPKLSTRKRLLCKKVRFKSPLAAAMHADSGESAPARFFDFFSESQAQDFLRGSLERCDQLSRVASFPLRVAPNRK
ncbi:uncharacterized protein LOC133544973 [Nerophis ophidion]|uniref:uncharacterized protein LOC133544973 n=1 Tax=Nerophis ophidion TaxID=159077 RepID=UPI002ADFAD35|nr:uncharacterized protein LOC133544973 [Nerophis ophidion]XP_061746223.1 uncharacterized protein LOC133544973 [Nerophis ophidion]